MKYDFVAETAEFFFTLIKEGERAAVVIGASRIETALERLLKGLLFQSAGGSDNLFDEYRPCSTFSAKIVLAHRLGIIDSDFEHALQMFRKIRNDFAHSMQAEHLSNSRHKSRVQEIMRLVHSSDSWKAMDSALRSRTQSEDIANFCICAAVMLMILDVVALTTKRIEYPKKAKFDVSTWGELGYDKS
jgi:hypothetical protein